MHAFAPSLVWAWYGTVRVTTVPLGELSATVIEARVAVEQLQALADVGQADAGAGGRGRPKPRPVSATVTASLPCTISALTSSVAALGLRLEAVLDRVLDQRLDHHRRELGREQAVGHVDARLQAVFHAHLEDLEVGPDHRHLAAQVVRRRVRIAHRRHRGPQQRDQVLLHLAGARRIGLDQVIDRGQRVEQEVRLDLRLHRRHARLDDLALELFRLGRLGRHGRLHLGLDACPCS